MERMDGDFLEKISNPKVQPGILLPISLTVYPKRTGISHHLTKMFLF
jgi:hypothetical protein